MKHTPGPWITHSDNSSYPLWDEDGLHPIADVIDELNERSKEEIEANARLIAAAPELLKTIQAIRARINGEWDHPALINTPITNNTEDDIVYLIEKLRLD